MPELMQFLSGSADAATIGIFFAFWRLDKRMSRLEWWQEQYGDHMREWRLGHAGESKEKASG